mmetsp:Transcript_5762/g.14388  ORF Transcript_5762/g.14388 Transcript_5762/m.14388 type:complete len:161 (-) Transcript_5762:1374-1856(-)
MVEVEVEVEVERDRDVDGDVEVVRGGGLGLLPDLVSVVEYDGGGAGLGLGGLELPSVEDADERRDEALRLALPLLLLEPRLRPDPKPSVLHDSLSLSSLSSALVLPSVPLVLDGSAREPYEDELREDWEDDEYDSSRTSLHDEGFSRRPPLAAESSAAPP